MHNMPEPIHDEEIRGFVAQSSTVDQLPDERLAVLRRMDFAVLKDGEVGGVRATRDLCYGIGATAVVGFIGVVATVDWKAAMKAAQLGPFLWAGVLGVLSLAALGIAIFYHIQIRRIRGSSAYSILMKRLEDHFSETNAESTDVRTVRQTR
jgi:hypothetical protein